MEEGDEECEGEGGLVGENQPATKTTSKTAMKMGVPCQGPLLRDIAVLTLVSIVSMSYLERGVVDYGFVYTLLAMYVVYVLTVLGADVYHLMYHLPKVRRSESGVSLCSNEVVGNGVIIAQYIRNNQLNHTWLDMMYR